MPSGVVENPTSHSFVQSPLTKPKVWSLRLYVDSLDDLHYVCMENNAIHSNPGKRTTPPRFSIDDSRTCTRARKWTGRAPVGTFRDEEAKGCRHVGGGRGSGNFVVINDFISVLHPYLVAGARSSLRVLATTDWKAFTGTELTVE